MSTASLLIAAMLLDAALGEPRWLWSRIPHPAVLMGRFVDLLDRGLNRGPNLHRMGVIAAAILALVAVLIGLALSQLGPFFEILIAAMLLAQRSLVEHVKAVADALRLSTEEGRRLVARIVSRDCSEMDQAQVSRAAIESAAENLSDGVVAPAFWFLLFGLPGLLLYKVVNTADSMIGYRTERYEQFGWAAAKLDDMLNLIPARLTGFLIAGLSHKFRRWPEIAADARRHKSPNAGWPEAAMARALKIALAGPRSYHGALQDFPWVNKGARTDIGPRDIDAAVRVLWGVWLTFLLAAAVWAMVLMLH
ncbi:adenosylcobinamide-phosphate synthase CbiB [Falsiphaeobacter marinintestinus]|uniref:adenosylcobinamide-phosphate synthase CbiB n=1 Tax=Falsiphaeobacter marinintestinus TaxID=1492905 RepID=UPI0011B73E3D|nr:adenosylcobinamide-phosphate synthase CbiB [Phaeobacter marinintestinus]